MADEKERVTGPVMLDVTKVLRPPETRVATLGRTITLPRAIPISQLIAGSAGAVLGMLATALFGAGLQLVFQGGAIGAALGVLAVTWSPLEGESLLTWFGLEVLAYRRRTLELDGERVRIAIGICQLHRLPEGRFHLVPGAVEVNPASYDERGALRDDAAAAVPAGDGTSTTDRPGLGGAWHTEP